MNNTARNTSAVSVSLHPFQLPAIDSYGSTLGALLHDLTAIAQYHAPDALAEILRRHDMHAHSVLVAYLSAIGDLLSKADHPNLNAGTVGQVGFLMASLADSADVLAGAAEWADTLSEAH